MSLEHVTLTLLRGPFTARTWRGRASLLLSLLAGACFFLVTAAVLIFMVAAAVFTTRETAPAGPSMGSSVIDLSVSGPVPGSSPGPGRVHG